MMLLAAARDLMIVFLGIELMSIAVYVLAGLNRRSARSAEAALKYFLLGAFSTGFLLYGMALIYGATGSTNFEAIGERIRAYALGGTPLVTIGAALLLVGFGFKVAAAPFHMWAPDVYEGAPTPITAYHGCRRQSGRVRGVHPRLAGSHARRCRPLARRALVPGDPDDAGGQHRGARAAEHQTACLRTRASRRPGTCSSRSSSGTTLGASAFLFYLAAYTLATMGAFAVVVALGRIGERELNLDDYAGLWSTHPWLATGMAVCMLALLGFPVFGGMGFVAKWYMIEAALKAAYLGTPTPQTNLAIAIVITSVISAGYYLRVVMIMFMRPAGGRKPITVPRAGGLTESVVLVSVVLLLVLGIMPSYLVTWSARSVPLVGQGSYYGTSLPTARSP